MYDPKTILSGQFWPEKVKVINSEQLNQDLVKIEAVGVKTRQFYESIVSSADVDKIKIEDEILTKFDGDAEKLAEISHFLISKLGSFNEEHKALAVASIYNFVESDDDEFEV